jgi:hypothetical protein
MWRYLVWVATHEVAVLTALGAHVKLALTGLLDSGWW